MSSFLDEKAFEENGNNESKIEQSEDFESWPLSGVVRKKTKSLNTYEKRHKNNESVTNTKHKQGDVEMVIVESAHNIYDEKHMKEIEDNLFRNDDEDTVTSVTTDTSPTSITGVNETKTRLQTRVKQDGYNTKSPRVPKGRLSIERGNIKSNGIIFIVILFI